MMEYGIHILVQGGLKEFGVNFVDWQLLSNWTATNDATEWFWKRRSVGQISQKAAIRLEMPKLRLHTPAAGVRIPAGCSNHPQTGCVVDPHIGLSPTLCCGVLLLNALCSDRQRLGLKAAHLKKRTSGL